MDPFSVALIRYRRRTPGLMFRLKIRCLWFVTVLEKARERLRRLRLFKTIKARRRPINDRVTVAAWCSSVRRLQLFKTIKARRSPNGRRRRTWRRPGCPPGNGPRKDWVRAKRIVESTKYSCAGSIYFLDGGFSFGVAFH